MEPEDVDGRHDRRHFGRRAYPDIETVVIQRLPELPDVVRHLDAVDPAEGRISARPTAGSRFHGAVSRMGTAGKVIDLLPRHPAEPAEGPGVGFGTAHICLQAVVHAHHADGEILPGGIGEHPLRRLRRDAGIAERAEAGVQVGIGGNQAADLREQRLRTALHAGHRHPGKALRIESEPHCFQLIDHQLLGNVENRAGVVEVEDDVPVVAAPFRGDEIVQGTAYVRRPVRMLEGGPGAGERKKGRQQDGREAFHAVRPQGFTEGTGRCS